MAYHVVSRLEDGRRAVATYATREKAEAHRNALIAQDPRNADVLFILEDDADEESGSNRPR
jgi:hypothetical protein